MDFMHISQLGILNKVSTSNAFLDVLICMLLPILFRPIASWFSNIQSIVDLLPTNWLWTWKQRHTRKLVYTHNPNLETYNISDIRYAHLAIMDMLNRRKPEWIGSMSNCDVAVDKSFTGNGMIVMPPSQVWIPIGNGIRVMISVKQDDTNNNNNRITTYVYVLEAMGPSGGKAIDEFLEAEYKYYMDNRQRFNRNGKLFMYIPQLFHAPVMLTSDASQSSSLQSSDCSMIKYDEYELKNQKHLRTNVFFPERKRLIGLLDTFSSRNGRYAIEGYPYQLGILLHGVPGTGKTSIIKAVANYTKRHLVFVDLARVANNQQLTQIMFEERRYIKTADDSFHIPPQEVIFVLEDIDAASDAVLQRDASKESRPSNTGVTLAGLLNALDGPLDGSGRIIIMTSNYPEKLDKALVRPGRIDLQIGLTAMDPVDATAMVQHYVTQRPLAPEESRQFSESYKPMTPADLQGVCLACETFEDVIAAM